MCHRESGYLQEIAQEVAMRNSQNVWVDGSLRDGNWCAAAFALAQPSPNSDPDPSPDPG